MTKKAAWIVWDVALCLALGWVIVAAMGCTFTLKDQGEIGFKQSTEWAFYHTASETHSTASSNLEAPSVEEWLFKDKDSVPPPSPTEPAEPEPPGGTPDGG